MKIAFFTEAGTKRGMGHLIRCQAIANEFNKNNIFIDFFLETDINYDYKFDNLIYFKWEDLKINKFYDAIFIDSYEADISIYEFLSQKSKISIYIDDYERMIYPKGIIINFAPDAKELFFKNKKDENDYLLGIDYLPIREIFFKYKEQKKKKQIFIMLGGSDTANLSQSILEGLKDINIKKLIVINNKQIIANLEKYKNIEILFKPTDEELVRKMAISSYAISTASMGLYELSFFNVSTIIISVSLNQNFGISQMIRNKFANVYIDINKKNFLEIIKNEMIKLIIKKEKPEKKVDELGAKRIYEHIIKRLQ
jgi:spore coat polysaccharide biosynthesis predicted glycosyltransferase SpsG